MAEDQEHQNLIHFCQLITKELKVLRARLPLTKKMVSPPLMDLLHNGILIIKVRPNEAIFCRIRKRNSNYTERDLEVSSGDLLRIGSESIALSCAGDHVGILHLDTIGNGMQ